MPCKCEVFQFRLIGTNPPTAIGVKVVPAAIGSTPFVQYTYSSPANGSRITSMVYPNGRTIDYNYSGTNLNSALDNAIGRLDAIVDGANSGDAGQVLEQYSYLGLSTIVQRNHPQTGINLTYLGPSGSIGAGGDQYVGLDQFGRVVNQNWVNSSGVTVDGYTYSYDANGNVTAKNNTLDSAYSQAFTYDQLNRLANATQGGSAYQSWNLDSQGNWSSFTSQGSTQTETANAQNQITSISGSTTPTYDAAGNMISGSLTGQPAGSADTLTYNAWNQLVEVKNASGTVIAQYTYNAMGYRVTETYPQGGNGIAAGTTLNIYYDSSWQAIETRTDGTASSNVTSQTVWSAAYINAVVLQDTYSAGVIQPNSRLYFLQDANWNTTAIVGLSRSSWQVIQRYVYSPYGTVTTLDAGWMPQGTPPGISNLYQGMALDPVTGLYYARNRNYSPSLESVLRQELKSRLSTGVAHREINQDPAGFINGANTYQFVMSNPVGNVDPEGLDVVVLISPSEAAGFGHAAVIVGNNASGWDYYSKNGRTGPFSLWGGNEGRHEHYNTLADFFAAMNHSRRYPDWIRIPTPPGVDKAMRGWANKDVYTPYYVWGPNCAALAQGTLQAGGIPFGRTGYWSDGWGPAVPDKLFNNLVTETLNFQLGSGVTITTAQGSTTVTFQK